MTNLIEIPFGDQKWKVTPFHCIVGDLKKPQWLPLIDTFCAHYKVKVAGLESVRSELVPLTFNCYPIRIKGALHSLRMQVPCLAFFTHDPLIVNEMQLEECTLASVEDGKVILTNFTDLYDAETAKKVYFPGEFWLSYCEGGAERNLRFGERNPRARMG